MPRAAPNKRKLTTLLLQTAQAAGARLHGLGRTAARAGPTRVAQRPP